MQNNDGIFISQAKYLKEFLNMFGLECCKPIGTPMITSHNLSSKDETPTIEKKNYRPIIGGLQYLTHTRPNIYNALGIVARFQANPMEYHFVVVKRIFIYLKGTFKYGIWYDRSSDFTLCAYTDVDWGSTMDDKKKYQWWSILSWRKIDFLVEQETRLYISKYN